jgi:YbbR domain-containing protein
MIDFLIEFFTRNLWWKLFAVLIAVLLWIAVANEPELSTFVSVPVEYRELPDQLEISSEVVEKVELEMRGPSGELRNFSATRTAVVLDMSDAQPGERTYSISDSDVQLPRGLRLIRAIPSQVHFVFERREQRMVPVEARFSEPPASYRVTPASLPIAGPASRVDRTRAVVTDRIDLEGVSGSGTFHVNAFGEDPHVKILSDSEVTVEVWMKK